MVSLSPPIWEFASRSVEKSITAGFNSRPPVALGTVRCPEGFSATLTTPSPTSPSAQGRCSQRGLESIKLPFPRRSVRSASAQPDYRSGVDVFSSALPSFLSRCAPASQFLPPSSTHPVKEHSPCPRNATSPAAPLATGTIRGKLPRAD